MRENEFLLELEKRAIESEKLIRKSSIAFILSSWFGEHPWRIVIPLSLLSSLLLRIILGKAYLEAILWIFGGL